MSSSARLCAVALACCAVLASCRATVVEPELPPAWSESDAARPLSREDCIELALNSAPTAAAWKSRIEFARASFEQARLLPNPTLSLAWEDFALNAAAGHNSVQTTLTLAMALEDVFARKRRSAAASFELVAEEASLRAERVQLAAEVARAYDGLVTARSKVKAQQELAGMAVTQRAAVEKFVGAGVSARIDLERAEAELAASQAALATSEAQARALELAFEFSLGFARPVTLELADELTSSTREPMAELSDLLARSAANRPDIEAATARYEAELERLKLAAERVQFLPTVAAGPRTQGDEVRGVASFDVVLPLFDTGAAAERGQQAALLRAAAELRQVAQRVAAEVCAASERLSSTESYLSAHARDLADRRRTLRERTERLFTAGEVEYGELALARRDEVEARIALLDAELAAAEARIDFDAALGDSAAAREP